MARLFLTQRELNFFSDITKEFIHDIVGQKIFYYPVSEAKTKTHGVYNESLNKIFDNPIEIGCLVDNSFQTDTKINSFGVDAQFKIEAFIQYRDLVERGINVTIGDFFSFSDVFYEITERVIIGNIYGMPEHKDGVKLVGTKAREGLFKALTVGPTDISRPEADAVQTTFVQKRGASENSEGPTGDTRALIESGVLDPPLTGPREVKKAEDNATSVSTFYDED